MDFCNNNSKLFVSKRRISVTCNFNHCIQDFVNLNINVNVKIYLSLMKISHKNHQHMKTAFERDRNTIQHVEAHTVYNWRKK